MFWLEQWVVQYFTSSLSCSSVFPDTLSHHSDTSHSPSPPLSPSILPFIPHSHSSHPPIHPSLTPLPSSPHSTLPILPSLTPLPSSHSSLTHNPPILPSLSPLPSSHPHSHPSHPPLTLTPPILPSLTSTIPTLSLLTVTQAECGSITPKTKAPQSTREPHSGQAVRSL